MIKRDAEIPTSRDVYPELKKLSTNFETCTVCYLLEEYWRRQGYEVSLGSNNRITHEPRVTIVTKEKRIIFDLCSENHPRDYNIQLAIALIDSCRGKFDSLPGFNATDEDFINHRPKLISKLQADEANTLLGKLAQN